MQAAGQWILILIISLSLFAFGPVKPSAGADLPEVNLPATGAPAPDQQSAQLRLLAPNTCPPAGCAPGQRLSLRFIYNPSTYDAAKKPNIKVCVYAPPDWQVNPKTVTPGKTGVVTGAPYTQVAALTCAEDPAKPADYVTILEETAELEPNVPGDAIDFSPRLGAAAAGPGQFVARLFEHNADDTWTRTASVTSDIFTMAGGSKTGFVANDAAGCGQSSPCYLNSGDDLTGGVGTGLKDAVDSMPGGSVITILGAYSIKSKAVIVNRPQTIKGTGASTLTFNGPGECKFPMLSLTTKVTLQDLTINDGVCSSPGRNLVEVNSGQPVVITSNNLTSGDNAIFIQDNSGSVTVSLNNITGNAGYAVFAEEATKEGPLNVFGNNLNNNRSGSAVDCASKATNTLDYRKANHNYWGSSLPDPVTQTHCNVTGKERLGMPIATRANKPGTDGKLVTVNDGKKYEFNNQIAFKRSGGKDFNLYILNYGYNTPGGPPFSFDLGGENPAPCSNYWNIFLPDGQSPEGTLELYFKYDRTSACLATINSDQYCDQDDDMENYPLFWYDPVYDVTDWWDVTGDRPETASSGDGQDTSCDISRDEIHVSIDDSGRPSIDQDLVNAQFMVGIPLLKSFTPLASYQTVTVSWTTNNEPDVVGFYVLRGSEPNHLSPISDLIDNTGTALLGRYYYFVDSGRTNGVTYHYRLQIVREDGSIIYSPIKSVVANVATRTPSPTPRPTSTATKIRPTWTPYPTARITQQPTRIRTRTFTPYAVYPTATRMTLPTLTPNPFTETPGIEETFAALTLQAFELQTEEAPLDESGYPVENPGDYFTPGPGSESTSGTPVAMVTGGTPGSSNHTPAPFDKVTPAAGGAATSSGKPQPWLSLFLGILAGTGAAGAAAGAWWFSLRLKH